MTDVSDQIMRDAPAASSCVDMTDSFRSSLYNLKEAFPVDTEKTVIGKDWYDDEYAKFKTAKMPLPAGLKAEYVK